MEPIKLKWRETEEAVEWTAETPFGRYIVTKEDEDKFDCSYEGEQVDYTTNKEYAIESAQEDFNKRIKKCIAR